MIWKLFYNLTRNHRRRKYFRSALKKADDKIWESEFLKHQILEVRGGMREQYDWLRERVEGAIRRRAENKWTIYYAETDDEVKVMDLPLPPREIEKLPDKPTKPHRFYKKDKVYKNAKDGENAVATIAELERIIEKRQPDLDQHKKQLEQVDMKVQEIDNTIAGTFELKKSLNSMLNKV